MLVREIMTSPAYSVLQDAPPEEAFALMAATHITGLPVVDDGGRVVGIITEADLLKAQLEPDPRAHMRLTPAPSVSLPTTVGQLMTAHPHTVREDTDVADVAHTFASTSWKSVPVVRGDLLLGVVSRSDVIRAIARPDSEIVAEISRILAESGLTRLKVDVRYGIANITGPATERERSAATSVAQSVMGVRRVIHQQSDA